MRFRDEYYFLSNMYPCDITLTICGVDYTFSCVEAAFQAHKEMSRINEFVGINGFEAKKLGRKVNIFADWGCTAHWNRRRVGIMRIILMYKFDQHPDLLEKLLAIDGPIVEENTWNDTFWGVCNGKGENQLGELLMEIRDKELKFRERMKENGKN